MVRFHHSISWNTPSESGGAHGKASDQDSHTDFHHLDFGINAIGEETQSSVSDCDGDSFDAGIDSRSHLRSHRSFFLPLHYTPGYQYPLIIWLHSGGFNENQIDQVMPHISVRNYIGVGIRGTRAADSSGHRFDWHHSPAAISATHDHVAEAWEEATDRFSVNPNRIVLAGFRDGGTMALRIAMRQPERFAGAASIGGRMPQGAIRNLNELRKRKLPMLWQWGKLNPDYTADSLKSDCRSAMSIGSDVEIRQYPGEDEMDTVVLKDLDEWIMRRIVSSSSVTDDQRWSSSPTRCSTN